MKSFEDLECWKACTELRRLIRELIKKFPADEKFGLISQIKNASRSTTHNIAEGYGRFHFKENIQFCRQSRGSLYEVKDQLIVALDDGYISKEEFEQGIILFEKAVAILNGYIKFLIKSDADFTTNKKTTLTN